MEEKDVVDGEVEVEGVETDCLTACSLRTSRRSLGVGVEGGEEGANQATTKTASSSKTNADRSRPTSKT